MLSDDRFENFFPAGSLCIVVMRKEGHLGVSMLLAVPCTLGLAVYGFPESGLLFGVVATLLFWVPDIDIALQRMTGSDGIPLVRRVVSISHRGITHTLWFGLAVGIVLSLAGFYAESQLYSLVLFGAGVAGITFHAIGDVVTPSGVSYIPFVGNTSLDLFYYDNTVANLGFLGAGFVAVGLLVAQSTWWFWIAFGSLYGVVVPLICLLATLISVRMDGRTIGIVRYFDIRNYL